MVKPGDSVDRYEVEALLGTGGMASVWRVRHTLLGSPHALKVLRPELVEMEDLRDRFLAEGRIQAQLRHPNIAAVTDVVAEPGVAGLILELLEGKTLEERLTAGPKMEVAEALTVFLPVCDALAYAHEAGVVHRDLKPSNVFLHQVRKMRKGSIRPVILDFGVARVVEEGRLTTFRRSRTLAGARMGTVRYMSPEQLHDASEVTAASDIFTMGVMVYEALIGVHPFEAASEFETMKRIEAGQLTDPARLLPAEAGAFAALLHRALSPSPSLRFPDAGALLEAMERVRADLRGAALEVARPTPPPPVNKRPVGGVTGPSGAAALVDASGKRHRLTPPRMIVGALRGNVEVLQGLPPHYSHVVLERTEAGWTLQERSRLQTLVNDKPNQGGYILQGGESLTVNGFRFRFEPS